MTRPSLSSAMPKRPYDPDVEAIDSDLDDSLPVPARSRRVSPDGDLGDDAEVDLDQTAPLSVLAAVLEDPEDESISDEGIGEVAESDIVAAESVDLAVFSQGRGRGYEEDAFEEWVKISRRHPPLPQPEMDYWIGVAHGDDPEMVLEAEDKLVRHNIKWIVRCLRANPLVGPDVMDMPGGLRDDALSLGRMGFLQGIRKYDPHKALRVGKAGHKKTLLKYGEYWIDKLAGEFMHQERFLLPEDASLDRKKVQRAIAVLSKQLGQDPSAEQISSYLDTDTRQRVARKDLRQELGRAPSDEEVALRVASYGPEDERRLRRRGALSPDRVRELREHQTHRPSLDAPAASGDESSPTLTEYIAGEDAELGERVADIEVYREVADMVHSTGDPMLHYFFRVFHAMPTEEGDWLHVSRTNEEVGLLLGRSRGSLSTYEVTHRRWIAGEREVPEEMLSREGFGFSVHSVDEALKGAGKKGGRERLDEIRARILDAAYLPQVLVEDGAAASTRRVAEGVACPLASHPGEDSSFKADASRFSCSCCGVGGDLFRWMELRHGLNPDEAVREAARRVIGIPPALVQDGGKVVVQPNASRAARLRRLG